MPSKLTRADVERVAGLAHLELTEAEIEQFTGQLGAILTYAEQIQRVDTERVPPAAAPTAGSGRADELAPSLPRDGTFENAPDADRATGLFRVPRVIG